MITITRDSPSPEYSAALARGLADVLQPGDTVLLRGPLGAGKTLITRAIAEGLGVDPRLVSSPTYVVINQYPAPSPSQPNLQIAHVDAYRLAGGDDLDALGWDRFFDPAGTAHPWVIALIEWPERVEGSLAFGNRTSRITIEPAGPTARRITIELPDAWRDRPGAPQLIEREPITCRVTGKWVAPTSPTYPFADERAKMADLNKWFTGSYTISREINEDNETE